MHSGSNSGFCTFCCVSFASEVPSSFYVYIRITVAGSIQCHMFFVSAIVIWYAYIFFCY